MSAVAKILCPQERESFKEVAWNQLEVEPGEAPALWESELAHNAPPVALTENPIKGSHCHWHALPSHMPGSYLVSDG